jgi:hypothetical protein
LALCSLMNQQNDIPLVNNFLNFSNISDPGFQALVAKARETAYWGILNKYRQKELRDYAFSIRDPMSDDELRFLYCLENPANVKNILCGESFDPLNFSLAIPVTMLAETPSGAKITLDLRTLNEGGGLGKFVCDHTARVINAFCQASVIPSLQQTGFIHVPEFPDFLQFAEVLGAGLAGIYAEYCAEGPVRIMLTGFTRFGRVKDNPTSEFLFGDGKSTETETFGFYEPSAEAVTRLDNMVRNQFGEQAAGEPLTKNNLKTGRTYSLPGNKKLDLLLVRLPVDTNIKRPKNNTISLEQDYSEFLRDVGDNFFGDRVQHILHYTAGLTRPQAIISLGAHCLLPPDFYEIETEVYGLDPKYSKGIRPVYPGRAGKGTNASLADVYRRMVKRIEN